MIGIQFSKKFLEKAGHLLGLWWDVQWQERLVEYNVKSEGFVDIRKAFKVTAEGELILQQLALPFKDLSNDEKIYKIAKFVNKSLRYSTDDVNYGKVEYWADPYETYKRGVDDCDGFAVLIAYLGWAAGIPRYRLKVVAGEIKYPSGAVGGHAYCQYLKEKDNWWYTIEGSWYADESFNRFNQSIPHSDSMKRYGKLWWSTTDEKSFAQQDMKIRGGVV